MARSKRKPARTPFWKRARYLILLLSGGGMGIGGWQLTDHPILNGVVQHVRDTEDRDPPDTPATSLKAAAARVLAKIKAQNDPFRNPGTYHVEVASVKLDPALYKPGRVVDIRVRVHKRDALGGETVVWDSKPFGDRVAVIGRDDPAASWPYRPFQVEWKPGEALSLEVLDRKGLVTSKAFEMEQTPDGSFPLRTGPHALLPVARTGEKRDKDLSRVVFESRRLADSTSGRERKPLKDVSGRFDDTIRIR